MPESFQGCWCESRHAADCPVRPGYTSRASSSCSLLALLHTFCLGLVGLIKLCIATLISMCPSAAICCVRGTQFFNTHVARLPSADALYQNPRIQSPLPVAIDAHRWVSRNPNPHAHPTFSMMLFSSAALPRTTADKCSLAPCRHVGRTPAFRQASFSCFAANVTQTCPNLGGHRVPIFTSCYSKRQLYN